MPDTYDDFLSPGVLDNDQCLVFIHHLWASAPPQVKLSTFLGPVVLQWFPSTTGEMAYRAAPSEHISFPCIAGPFRAATTRSAPAFMVPNGSAALHGWPGDLRQMVRLNRELRAQWQIPGAALGVPATMRAIEALTQMRTDWEYELDQPFAMSPELLHDLAEISATKIADPPIRLIALGLLGGWNGTPRELLEAAQQLANPAGDRAR